MKYFLHDFESYRLHIIKTDKFKTISFKIIFSEPVVKEEITKKNFLADILTYSSGKYKKRKDLSIALQDLYAMEVFSSCYRIGKLYNMDVVGSFLNEKYTEKGMFDKSIELLSEIIFNPNVNNSEFDKESFDRVKELSKNQIESVKEDTRKLSLINMLENMGKNEMYSYHGFGYTSDLKKITMKNLYEYYEKVLTNSKIDIYILGDVDVNHTIDIIGEKFNFNVSSYKPTQVIINHNDYRKRIKKVVDKEKLSQSKLSIGCKMINLSDFERHYVLPIYSIILGGGSDSKLFKTVREKNSLCYYISSMANKLDNILFITSGISSINFDKVLKLVKESMKDIELGKFSIEDIDKAKIQYITMLDELQEDPFQIISAYYSVNSLGYDDIETRIKEIKKVTYDDIKSISKKIHMDTVYLLKGDE